jgi:DNA-directed RNA polymerase subunit beta'
VDYSGRSVIVVGPDLNLHQCGLPKKMAIELFKPFIYNKLEEHGLAQTIKQAKKMVEEEGPEVWDILAEVIREHPVLLNRAPTLHRLGIQAFEPVLTEGKAIRLHPLVCTAFNADFDGDQMAVHVPLSIEAQLEARVLMMSTNNVLSPANGRPVIQPSQDVVLGVYYMTRSRPSARGAGMVFSGAEEARVAYDQGVVELHAPIRCRVRGDIQDTSVGRVLLSELLPDQVPFDLINRKLDKKALGALIEHSYRVAGGKATVILADRLMALGFEMATAAGVSIAIGDMQIPEEKESIVREALNKVEETEQEYRDKVITSKERSNKIIDIWSNASDRVAERMLSGLSTELDVVEGDGSTVEMESFNPIYMMVDSGARGSKQQIRQLAGMRGLMAKPSGDIIETPILANFREGLSVLQYFVSTHGARKGLADTALKTANSGYLTRRLVDVVQDYIVQIEDCGTSRGRRLSGLVDAGTEIKDMTLENRVLGRYTAESVHDPLTGEVLIEAHTELQEENIDILVNAGVSEVVVRSPLTCSLAHGVCASCYGRDLARGRLVNPGEAVGVIAAQSIGEPGTQLTMRTFHVGGAASAVQVQSHSEARFTGEVVIEDVKPSDLIHDTESRLLVIGRRGQIVIRDRTGRERERHPLPYGAHLMVEAGQLVEPKAVLAQWDPHSTPIICEVDGFANIADLLPGQNTQEIFDPVTGRTQRVIIESRKAEFRPRVEIREGPDAEEVLAQYPLPVGATLVIEESGTVNKGFVLARIPREMQRARDITGGLPRVSELFEARKPRKGAIITTIDGTVSFGKDIKNRRRIVITPDEGDAHEYLIPKIDNIIVREGEYVRAGDPLIDGVENPHELLKVRGEIETGTWIVDEIQKVYQLQGVTISDKHIEVVVRQMLRRVKIKETGDSDYLLDQNVERHKFEETVRKLVEQGKKPPSAVPILLGITKASLATDSWISAASFQETTRVLTEAALGGRIDYLRGLKENVTMGRLIPAGTGFQNYHRMDAVEVPDAAEQETGVA